MEKLTNLLFLSLLLSVFLTAYSKTFVSKVSYFNSSDRCPIIEFKRYVLSKNGQWQVCPNLKLARKGTGVIRFQAKGNDIYVRLVSNPKTPNNYTYWLVISGWSNSRTVLYGAGGRFVCQVGASGVDLNKIYDYEVAFIKKRNLIKVKRNGRVLLKCNDKDGYQGSASQYLAIGCFCNGPSSKSVSFFNVNPQFKDPKKCQRLQ